MCKLPDPFIVPVFRESREENIFYPDDRKFIVRVLVTVMLATGSRVTTSDCDHVAKALVRKFPEGVCKYKFVYCKLFINCSYNSNLGLTIFM